MEEKTDWSRRAFLGMSALGVLGLAGCGGGTPAAPQVDVQVPKALLDQAAALRGGSVGMLSQKLYSEAANKALDTSLQVFAQATGTTVRNDLVSGPVGGTRWTTKFSADEQVRLMYCACRAAHRTSVMRLHSCCPVGVGLPCSARSSQSTVSNQACAVRATG